MWKLVAAVTAVTCGGAAIFPPGVPRTEPALSLATTMFESRAFKPSTSGAMTHRPRPATPEKGA
jgi:hypothetical protein